MRAFRRLLFWIHLTAGVVAGSIVLVMSVTGVLLTYDRQIVDWADRRSAPVASHAPTTRLGADALLAAARVGRRGEPTSLTVSADPTRAATVSFGRNGTLLLDPYTGAALGAGATRLRKFFRGVEDWHRWIGRTGERRAAGQAVADACNLAFFLLVLTGAYLWIPRTWTRIHVRNVAWFRRGLRAKARDFNWHNVIGIWSLVPLIVVVGSGVVMSYPWANALVYRAVGDRLPARTASAEASETGDAAQVPDGSPTSAVSLDTVLARATHQVPAWRTIQLSVPDANASKVIVSIDAGTGGQPQQRGTLTLDRATGAVQNWEPFASLSIGRRVRAFLRFAHTGEVGGIVGQTIAGLASLGAVVLVWTGIALALRRLLAWAARRRRSSLAHTLRQVVTSETPIGSRSEA